MTTDTTNDGVGIGSASYAVNLGPGSTNRDPGNTDKN